MIGHELREFVDRVMDKHAIDDQDVKLLQREILVEGVMTRDVIDVLVALDRAVETKAASFANLLVALVVDFAVWESRPTGVIDRDKAHWLVASLAAGEGPTPTARRIAFEIVREADRCDEALLAFVLRSGIARPNATGAERVLLAS